MKNKNLILGGIAVVVGYFVYTKYFSENANYTDEEIKQKYVDIFKNTQNKEKLDLGSNVIILALNKMKDNGKLLNKKYVDDILLGIKRDLDSTIQVTQKQLQLIEEFVPIFQNIYSVEYKKTLPIIEESLLRKNPILKKNPLTNEQMLQKQVEYANTKNLIDAQLQNPTIKIY